MINLFLFFTVLSSVFSLVSIFCVFCILSYIDTVKFYGGLLYD